MKKSIAKVGYAPITRTTSSTGTTDTYGAVTWLESEKAGGREYSAEPRGEVSEVYADGKVVLSLDSNDGYDIKLTLLDIIDDIKKAWLSQTASTDGIVEYGNVSEYPSFALLLAEDLTNATIELTTYYNTQVTKRPTKNGKTSEGKFEAQFKEFELAARPRSSDTAVCFEKIITSLPTAVPEPTFATASETPSA